MRVPARLTAEQREIAAANLVRFREELAKAMGRDVNQDEVADLAGISVDTYRSYEGRRRGVGLPAIIALSQFYDRPVEDFLNPEPPPRPKGWRPPTRTRFMAIGLDDDLAAQAERAVDEVKRMQLDRIRAAKEDLRRGKKL